jgi:hypothetical protein
MTDKVKIMFALPMALQKDLKEHVVKDNYGLRGKSRWVSEAIVTLLGVKSLPELVKLNDAMQGFEKLESIVVARNIKKQLDEAVIDIRKHYPAIEGVQSRIVRTAIVQRLLGY